MKNQVPDVLEAGRITSGRLASTAADGFNGVFIIKGLKGRLRLIVSDEEGWEHVSGSYPNARLQIPSWKEMCFVKDLIWKPDEVVVQYHPAESDYVNIHPGVLHLWRPTDVDLPLPPKIFV